jgi:potassium inwardly-rectifying channel subfamily J, other
VVLIIPMGKFLIEEEDRLVDRGSAGVKSLRISRDNRILSKLFFIEDIFHSLLDLSNWKVLLVAYVFYNLVLLFFALLYYFISKMGRNCHTDFKTFLQSMFFSLQTFTSIGFGASDPYFDSCGSMFLVIAWESFTVIIVNAFAIGVFYARFARSQERAATVVFSKKAVICNVGGSLKLLFRICDFKRTHLIDAHVRCFVVQHAKRAGDQQYFAAPIKLQYPDEDMGGMLLLALPSQVCISLVKAENKEKNNCPLAPSHLNLENMTFQSIKDHWTDLDLELVVLVQGVEPLTSHSTQARFSYKIEDIEWQKQFKPCVETVSGNRDFNCRINFSKFDSLSDISGQSRLNRHESNAEDKL